MSVDLYGWLEVRDMDRPSGAWSGFLSLHHLVGASRELFPLIYQSYPATGLRALRYELGPRSNTSHEMQRSLDEAGLASIPCFTVGWAELEPLASGPTASWPWLDLELWWRDNEGVYHLKSRAHQLSRLSIAEASTVLDSGQPFDKHQYRYVARHSQTAIEVPARWQTLLQTMRHVANSYGADNVRMVGFFE